MNFPHELFACLVSESPCLLLQVDFVNTLTELLGLDISRIHKLPGEALCHHAKFGRNKCNGAEICKEQTHSSLQRDLDGLKRRGKDLRFLTECATVNAPIVTVIVSSRDLNRRRDVLYRITEIKQ
jgi:hypothetical protein